MGVRIAAVGLGVDLCGIRHIARRVGEMRLREERVVCSLSVIAILVALRGKLVIIGRRAMMFGGAGMRLGGGMGGHIATVGHG